MLCMIWGTQYFLTRALSVLFPDIFFPKISQKDPLRKRVFATMKQFFVEFVLICFPATAIITDVNVYIYNLVLILLFVVLLIIARKSILSFRSFPDFQHFIGFQLCFYYCFITSLLHLYYIKLKLCKFLLIFGLHII